MALLLSSDTKGRGDNRFPDCSGWSVARQGTLGPRSSHHRVPAAPRRRRAAPSLAYPRVCRGHPGVVPAATSSTPHRCGPMKHEMREDVAREQLPTWESALCMPRRTLRARGTPRSGDDDEVAAFGLRPVGGGVGVLDEQVRERLPGVHGDADADAPTWCESRPEPGTVSGVHGECARRCASASSTFWTVGQRMTMSCCPPAGDDVAVVHSGAKPFGDSHEDLVSGVVPERVVDLLETVEVHPTARRSVRRDSKVVQATSRCSRESGPVQHAGQWVVHRVRGQPLSRRLCAVTSSTWQRSCVGVPSPSRISER